MKTTKTQNRCNCKARTRPITFMLALLLFFSGMKAQVTIGDLTEPKEFSALEIVSPEGTGGMRLPQLTTAQRQQLEGSDAFILAKTGKAKGLTIFNTTTNCVETWNGAEWISMCAQLKFSPNYNVNSGTTELNLKGVFVKGTGDDKKRGTDVVHSSMAVGVFRYTNGVEQSYPGLDYTDDNSGVKVTIPPTILVNGSGELTVSVEGKVSPDYAGKAFDIPVTVIISGVKHQLYVRVNAGCGAYTKAKTIPSLDGDLAWLQFQCFNLGANTNLSNPFQYITGNADGSGGTLGYLYQWGRRTDGHQLRTSTTTDIKSASIIPNHSNFITFNPRRPENHPDWYSETANNTIRWGDGTENFNMQKGLSDPCPVGWKVPSQAQWFSLERFSDGKDASDSYMFGEALYLPKAGIRSVDGTLNSSEHYYWSSEAYNSSNTSAAVGGKAIRLQSNGYPARYGAFSPQGNSVRCVAN
ncbi:hypothetical protein M2451_003990 [Dysgonomonas sp. PFB1-18]|uniref:FISUMP domain-containing protein n=1 Tax=unclassified Dysgonomonas TaxID=2630389 RepID=UPI002476829C|nr:MULTISPECIES: FISUMP domain-containing protein [unclassified Dysgonomonas]MDH6311141.1 hypothetical protein [Dysgonomonas sp. PF1-14]MDH6341005.1 hypothetical protein [Dysgonomonas sp. PF1-16]MDH6382645.1 hypothetical protein [Dysgonomonas sp. PFB1-18]MDH6400006.1 hypothetical protein [Dysgonomonas sp. PF1-23]